MTNPNTPAVQAEKQLTPVDKLKRFLNGDAMKQQIMAALPKHIDLEKFLRILMTAVSQNPDLANADQNSLLIACMKCAADGLMPDGKEAALVTFRNKTKGIIEVSYMPMYAGILKKMRNSGDLATIEAHIVHKNDKFTYRPGIESKPIFEPDWFGADRGEVVGVFAIGVTKDGSTFIEVMSKAQVGDVRSVSRAQSGPWDGPFADEMAKKSVIRRLAKRMPTSTDVEQLFKHDNDNFELPAGKPAAAQIAAPAAQAQLTAPAPAAPAEPAAPKEKKSRVLKAMTKPAGPPAPANPPPPPPDEPEEHDDMGARMDEGIARGGVDYGKTEEQFQAELSEQESEIYDDDISPI